MKRTRIFQVLRMLHSRRVASVTEGGGHSEAIAVVNEIVMLCQEWVFTWHTRASCQWKTTRENLPVSVHSFVQLRPYLVLQNGDHDIFLCERHENMLCVNRSVSKPGVCGRILCSALQLSSRWRRIRTGTEIMDEDGSKLKMFEVEQTESFHSSNHGTYLQEPWLRRLGHTSMVQKAVYIWRKGLCFYYILSRVCYVPLGHIKPSYFGWTSQVVKR